MLLVFGNQQVNSLLWNTDLSDRCLRFGARECQLPIGVLDVLLADGDVFVRDVEVTPQEGGQLGELDIADAWNGVLLDHQAVAVSRSNADIGLGVDVVPAPQPRGHGVFVGAADIDALCGLHSSGQFPFALRLRLAEDIFDDTLAGFRVVACGVATLPPAIAAFADIAFAIGAFLGH